MFSIFSSILDRYFIKRPRFRQAVTRRLERDEDLDITLFGTFLRINSLKEHGYLRAARKVRRLSALNDEAGTLVTLSLLLCDGDTFVDVGANVGLFACTIARATSIWSNLRLYAFEANPDTCARLRESARDTKIKIDHVAISDRAGELEFIGGAVSHVFAESAHRNAYHFSGQSSVAVRCKRLDESDLKGNSIVLKIDVEGHEAKVLQGATRLFEEHRVKAVYIDGYNDEEVVHFLKRHGFLFFDGRTMRAATPPLFSLLAINPGKCGGVIGENFG